MTAPLGTPLKNTPDIQEGKVTIFTIHIPTPHTDDEDVVDEEDVEALELGVTKPRRRRANCRGRTGRYKNLCQCHVSFAKSKAQNCTYADVAADGLVDF